MGEMVSYETKAKFEDLRTENTQLRAALRWIADQVDNEDVDLDDIILCANKALAHEQSVPKPREPRDESDWDHRTVGKADFFGPRS